MTIRHQASEEMKMQRAGSVACRGMHHVALNVGNLQVSRRFYDDLLAMLGFRLESIGERSCSWLGGGIELVLYQSRHPRQVAMHDRYTLGLHHLAFRASEKAQVDQVHALACSKAARILDPPMAYPEYEPDYYACFFLDPDGMKLEVMYLP
jgi:glyoxylase I family protein